VNRRWQVARDWLRRDWVVLRIEPDRRLVPSIFPTHELALRHACREADVERRLVILEALGA
jgi:hypothetical protein